MQQHAIPNMQEEAKTLARLKLAHVRLALVHAIHEIIQI